MGCQTYYFGYEKFDHSSHINFEYFNMSYHKLSIEMVFTNTINASNQQGKFFTNSNITLLLKVYLLCINDLIFIQKKKEVSKMKLYLRGVEYETSHFFLNFYKMKFILLINNANLPKQQSNKLFT